MIIEVALFLLFVAIAGAFVVKAYEWRQDVLYGPLHQAERLEEVGSSPAIRPRSAERRYVRENNVVADRAEVKPSALNVLLTLSGQHPTSPY